MLTPIQTGALSVRRLATTTLVDASQFLACLMGLVWSVLLTTTIRSAVSPVMFLSPGGEAMLRLRLRLILSCSQSLQEPVV